MTDRGFTLLELLIVVAIVALSATMFSRGRGETITLLAADWKCTREGLQPIPDVEMVGRLPNTRDRLQVVCLEYRKAVR